MQHNYNELRQQNNIKTTKDLKKLMKAYRIKITQILIVFRRLSDIYILIGYYLIFLDLNTFNPEWYFNFKTFVIVIYSLLVFYRILAFSTILKELFWNIPWMNKCRVSQIVNSSLFACVTN